VLAVLATFDTEHQALRLSDIARRADLPLPTAHRLVAELTTSSALTKPADGSYVVGQRLWDLGLLAPAATGLREAASPFLHDIHAATRATVHLGVRDGTQVLYLDRIAGSASVPVVSRVGSRLPLYATGVGKGLLADAPPEVQAAVLSRLERIKPYTITKPGRLHAQLVRARAEGFAQTNEERSLGACSGAVPVRGGDGEVVAAVGIVVAVLRRDRMRLVAALQVAASGIIRSISGRAFH